MGFWNQLRSISDKLLNRNDPAACRSPNAAQNLEDYYPGSAHKDRIGQILTKLGRFAVDSAVSDSLNGFSGGMQVYNKTGKVGCKDQYADASSKPDITLTGEKIQAHLEKVQREMKSTKKELCDSANRCKAEAQLEEMHEEMKNTQPKIANLTRYTNRFKEHSHETAKQHLPTKEDTKRVMIRSRL